MDKRIDLLLDASLSIPDSTQLEFQVPEKDKTRKDWRRTTSYHHWKEKVIERDGYCKACGATEPLHAHHIIHAAHRPDLRYTVGNGICLCHDCHSKFHNDYVGSTRKLCDDKMLADFFKLKGFYSDLTLKLIGLNS